MKPQRKEQDRGRFCRLDPDPSVPSVSLWWAFFCRTAGYLFLPTPPAAGLLKCELHKGNPCVWSSRFSVRPRCRQRPNRSVHPPLAAVLRPHLNAKHSTQVSEPGIISFRSHCPFPHPAKLASMKRKFARRSARATPPAPAAPVDFGEAVAAPAPRRNPWSD